LLDFWPLKRFEATRSAEALRTAQPIPSAPAEKRKGKSGRKQPVKSTVKTVQPAEVKNPWALMWPLLREKMPLFALTAISCVVTYFAQQAGGSVASMEAFPLGDRVSNAFVSYVLYIGKMVWPSGLAVLYPHPGSLPLWKVLGAVALLSAVTLLALWRAKRVPYLVVGWLWYLGTLVPVIGIVQVGGHALADRYAYIPLIGLFIAAAWSVPEILKGWRWKKGALVASSALILMGVTVVTWRQVGYWQNNFKLYDHALEVTNQNSLIFNNRGAAYNDLGNLTLAISDFDRAIEINPKYDKAYYNRGNAWGQKGEFDRAIADFDRAIEINPRYAAAYFNRGNAYGEKGQIALAISDFDKAIEISPNYAKAYSSRGVAYLLHLKDRTKGCLDFRRACQLGDCRSYEGAKRAGVCE